jgi:hypothetical protein
MRFFWSVSCFSFLSLFSLFAVINGWTPTNFLWRRCTRFHLPRTLRFSLLLFTECSSFSATAFGFCFRLDLRLDLVISFHQGVFFASDIYWLSSKEVSLKISNGVGKEKKLYTK